jgi:N-acetylneuraminic acid mutarotase
LYLIGGTYWEGEKGNWTLKVFSGSTHVFDPSDRSWHKLPDAPVTLGYPACATVGREIFVMGGMQDGQPSPDVYTVQRDGSGLKWLRHSQLPEARLFASAVSIKRSIYILGGTRQFEPFDAKGTCCTSLTATNTLWVLDTTDAAKTWKPLAKIPGELRWGERAVTDGAAIYLFGGGYQAKVDDPVKKFNEVLRYEPSTDRWSRVADMPESMQGAAPVFAGGKIILVGSAKKAMIFEPKTGRFLPVDPLPEDASVDQFLWMDPVLVGASGESTVEGPRRRSPWTFIGRLN